jgi:cation diffusion facilitator family transporter
MSSERHSTQPCTSFEALAVPTYKENVARLAIVSIMLATAVTGMKYFAYLRTGSIALYSDALESIINVVTAVAAFVAVRIAARPADRRHPFGHQKAEFFSAGLEGALIVVAALMILREAHNGWNNPRILEAPAEGLAINGLATAINALWSWFLISRGRAWRSPAITADGWHLLTDVMTSVGVLLGLLLALTTGWWRLDPMLAAVVAVNILYTGWRITTQSVSGLMDESVAGEVLDKIRHVIGSSAWGAIQVHDLRTRTAGRATFIEFHLVVPGKMTVAAAHAICDRIEDALTAAIDGSEVLIHVEPEGEAKAKGALVF